MTVPGKPRIEFRPGEYPRIRYFCDGREWYVYLHRLTAFAHGHVESPFTNGQDSLHVHHMNHDKWDNRPENLEAREPSRHSTYHALHNHENGKW